MVTNDWKTALVMMIFITVMVIIMVYFMYRDSPDKRTPNKELRNLHFTPQPAPTSVPKFAPTSASEPWFLVVYDQDFKVSLILAADEILRFERPGEGKILVQCKHYIGGTLNDEISLEYQFEYKFLPASRLNDYLVNIEEQ